MTQSQLPAHLQKYQAPDVGAALSQNLGSAMPPHVSIEGGRFKLIDASNNEIPVPTFDPQIGPYLDACVIDVNNVMSRQYYIKPYDPSAAGTPPDCWSDNGVAASIGASSVPLLQPPHPRAGQPAATCSECPMSVWGSKISNLGSKIPACTQKQKIALLVPGFQTLFLLAVPPNSHSYLREYVERCKGTGVNMADVITRISFVPGVQGTLQFNPVNYIDEPTAILRQAAYTEKKTDALVGRNDVPRTAALAPPAQQIVTQPARAEEYIQPIGNVPITETAQRMAANFQSMAPAQQVQQPAPFVPTVQPGAPMATGAGFATVTEPAPTPRRRRRTAAEMQAAQPGQPAPAAAQAAPQAPFPHPGQAAPAVAQQAPFPASQQPSALPGQTDMGFGMAQGQPTGANPEVNVMLDNFFKQG